MDHVCVAIDGRHHHQIYLLTLKTTMTESSSPFYLFTSFCSTVFALVTFHDVQVMLTIIATMVSIVSGSMAGYYYYKKARGMK